SESTLSVDTSKSGSSSATVSPTALNHFVIVPSVTVSPSWGIVMSAMRLLVLAVQGATGEGDHRLTEHLGHRGVGLDQVGHVGHRGLPVHGQVPLAELLGDPGP